jgi:hypothetical protein
MPFPNEHSLRLQDPEKLKNKIRVRRSKGSGKGNVHGVKVPESIEIIWYIIKKEGKEVPVAQALRFPVSKWTEKKAKAWIKENKIKGMFESAKKEAKAKIKSKKILSSIYRRENRKILKGNLNADGSKSAWLLVFPRGKFYIEKYEEWLDFNDDFFEEIARAFESKTIDTPIIDIDHKYEDGYGELTAYKIEEKGMYFFTTLNASGVKLVREGKYKSFSPTFNPVTDTKGNYWGKVLIGISLCNYPALMKEIPSLKQVFQLKKDFKDKGGNMSDYKSIARALKIDTSSGEQEIISSISLLRQKDQNYKNISRELNKAIKKINSLDVSTDDKQQKR